MDQLEKRRQAGGKSKRKGHAVSKEQTQEDKLATANEKEEKKREKIKRKKALDERDLNILGQMSQLNRSIVIVHETRRLKKKRRSLRERGLSLRERRRNSKGKNMWSRKQTYKKGENNNKNKNKYLKKSIA